MKLTKYLLSGIVVAYYKAPGIPFKKRLRNGSRKRFNSLEEMNAYIKRLDSVAKRRYQKYDEYGYALPKPVVYTWTRVKKYNRVTGELLPSETNN